MIWDTSAGPLRNTHFSHHSVSFAKLRKLFVLGETWKLIIGLRCTWKDGNLLDVGYKILTWRRIRNKFNIRK